MVTNFFADLLEAQGAEHIVLDWLRANVENIQFFNVSNDKAYYHKGDILAIAPDGSQHFIEVKDDGTLWRTQNILCEEAVYYNNTGKMKKGNFYSDYEIYAVVSQQEHTIYFFDFDVLRAHYKSGKYKTIQHAEQTTYCYLCSLEDTKSWGALIEAISY